MKHLFAALLLVVPVAVSRAETIVPAGSVIQCMVSEPNISSKTTHIGDPVLCKVSRSELYGRATFPTNAYLVGHFEDYKDPGHFVGKGWMELRFDRMVVGNDINVPVVTRVVSTPKYPVDADGKIHGNGHPVRDIVEWSIPVLWPIDLINLPRRGPRPVLGPETNLTVKVLDDIGLPTQEEAYAAAHPALYSRNAPQETYQPYQPAPIERAYAQQPTQNVVIVQAPAQPAPVIVQAAAPQPQPIYVQQPQPAPIVNNYYTPPPPRPVVVAPYPYAYRYYGPY